VWRDETPLANTLQEGPVVSRFVTTIRKVWAPAGSSVSTEGPTRLGALDAAHACRLHVPWPRRPGADVSIQVVTLDDVRAVEVRLNGLIAVTPSCPYSERLSLLTGSRVFVRIEPPDNRLL
jgi:hypothetical protein